MEKARLSGPVLFCSLPAEVAARLLSDSLVPLVRAWQPAPACRRSDLKSSIATIATIAALAGPPRRNIPSATS